MAAATAFWASVLVAVVLLPGAEWHTVISAVLFLAFFLVFGAHYVRLAVVVGPEGIVFRSVLHRIPLKWDDILEVEVRPSVAGTLYAVLTRRGLVEFTSLLARHRELCQIVLEHAGLARAR